VEARAIHNHCGSNRNQHIS
jgi:hypothetical protein